MVPHLSPRVGGKQVDSGSGKGGCGAMSLYTQHEKAILLRVCLRAQEKLNMLMASLLHVELTVHALGRDGNGEEIPWLRGWQWSTMPASGTAVWSP